MYHVFLLGYLEKCSFPIYVLRHSCHQMLIKKNTHDCFPIQTFHPFDMMAPNSRNFCVGTKGCNVQMMFYWYPPFCPADGSIPLGCRVLLVRLAVLPGPKPWPMDDFLGPRSSINRPMAVVLSLSGVDRSLRSKYRLPLRAVGGGTGATPAFGRLDVA